MKRPTISVTSPAETQSAPWQFWSAPLDDLSGGEVAIGSLKDPGDYILQNSDISEDGGGAALRDVRPNAASGSTPDELASGASRMAFDAAAGNAELAASDLSESQEGLSGYPASDIDRGRAASESEGVAAPSVVSLPAVPSAAAFDTFNSFGYSPIAAAASIPVQLPPGVTFRGFDAPAAHDGAAQALMELAAHQDHNVAPGAAAMDGGGDLGPQVVLANPEVDFLTPIADSVVGPGGATAAQVQQALDESGLSVNGSGVRVGVLSDSFNDLGGAAADEADGALPSAANIDVIKDLAAGGTDEGRAMMQIIHDIAPGASLAFYTAFDSEQDFANGILALAAAGGKVIVDDVSYFDEPFFQNGVVAQAIQTVEAEGVTYVTAAGNEASNGYQSAWVPISGTYNGTTLTDAESFGGSLVQTITINTEGTGSDVPLLLEWNQAYGQATSDLEMLVFNSSGKLIGTATNASSGEANNPWVEYDFSQSGTYYVAIENLSGLNPGLIKEITAGDGLPATISGANSGTVFGHAMTPGVISAGAVSAADTPAFGFSSPAAESFSSSGAGTELLFANNGTALSSPDVLSPVAVSGVDDIQTTVPGGLSDFYGTSAASASLAGVAALMLSANPNLTPAQVGQIMEQTALPMTNSAVSGAGLVQVDSAVADVEAPIVTVTDVTLSAGHASVAASSLFTVSDANGQPITEYGFMDTGPGSFALSGVAQPHNQEINVAAAQIANLVYDSAPGTIDTLEIRAESATGWGSWAAFTVTAPPLVIQTDSGAYGTTSLTEIGDEYFLYNGGSGPPLSYSGTRVVAGEFGAFSPIAGVKTASGYEMIWKEAGAAAYGAWNLDTNGNYVSNAFGIVPGTSVALESAETLFNQDLNGDGVVGLNPLVIQTDANSFGSISLAELSGNYFLDAAGTTTGPELQYNGAAVTAGEFGAFSPIAGAKTASGFEIIWKEVGAAEYGAWNLDTNGNYVSNAFGIVPGTSVALESAETLFNQDLNGDGVVGLYAAPGTTLQISESLAGASAAATIGAGATLELTAADTGSATFKASTGMLRLDSPSTFTGEIFNFTGNGSLTGSDQIDLRTISYGSVHDSYESGALTVSDGASTVTLDFNGAYTLANFKFASDGSGGTIVYDPPASNSTVSGANTMVTADRSKDAFLFHPNLGQSASIDHTFGTAATLFDHAEFATAASANVHNAQESTMFGDAVHDTMTFHGSALAQPHHSHFLI
jgi:hypothetical protein